MSGFRSQANEVPEHIGILQVSLRISLLRVDEAREQNWIADEEDWRVITNQIPDAIVGVEFQGKASRIASCVGRATFAACRSTNIQSLISDKQLIRMITNTHTNG